MIIIGILVLIFCGFKIATLAVELFANLFLLLISIFAAIGTFIRISPNAS